MNEIRVDSIKVRSDLVGEFEKTNKLKGYAAECFLKKVLKQEEELLLEYLEKRWKLAPFIQFLANVYVEKYAKYLKDAESRKHIYEKYAEKQSTIDIICGRVTDLDASECIRLYELYDTEQFLSDRNASYKLIDRILQTYERELRLLIPDDTSKVKKLS